MKILISLVSKEVLPAYYSIAEFKPDKIYLIGTSETIAGMNRIAKVAGSDGYTVFTREVKAYDIEGCVNICEAIHKENGVDCEYIYNLTLGTKLMAFGAMKCAQSNNARMVYTTPGECIGINPLGRSPLLCKLTFEQMFELQGQILKEHEEYEYDAERTKCAEDAKAFVTNHKYRKAFSRIRKEYEIVKQNEEAFDEYEDTRICLTNRKNYLSIEYDGTEVFHSDYPQAEMILFEGRWWETFVANATAKWSGGKYDIWTSVIFEPKQRTFYRNMDESKNVKNEIDVLVNLGTTMLFIECKSGNVTRDNIRTLNDARQTYGSYQSKAVIVSLYALSEEVKEKAKECNIDVIVAKDGNLSCLPKELDRIINTLKA